MSLLCAIFSSMFQTDHLQGAFWFAVLLNLKHIFLYIAPVYVVYLFRAYCFTITSVDEKHTPCYSFNIMNLIKLGAVVVTVLIASFGPFIDHLPQVRYQTIIILSCFTEKCFFYLAPHILGSFA